jgi:hypothetical protein
LPLASFLRPCARERRDHRFGGGRESQSQSRVRARSSCTTDFRFSMLP